MRIRKKLLLSFAVLLIVLVTVELVFHFQHQLSLEYVQHEHEWLARLAAESFWKIPLLYLLTFWLLSALFLPVTTLVTIAAGAIFGLWKGVLLAMLAALSGGWISFFIARYLFSDLLQARFHARLIPLNQELHQHGGSYVFLLRMLPGIPFALTNLLMGVSTVTVESFLVFSFIGLLPRVFLYVNAGTQIASLKTAGDILSLRVVVSLVLLGLLPLLTRFVVAKFKRR